MKNSVKISLVSFFCLTAILLLALNFGTDIQSNFKIQNDVHYSEIDKNKTDQMVKDAAISLIAPQLKKSLEQTIKAAKNNDDFEGFPATCFAPDTDQAVIDQFYQYRTAMANSLGLPSDFRFNLGNRWNTTASDGGGLGQGDATTLTWSYVPDGTVIANGCGVPGESSDPSSFIAFFNGIFGGPTVPGDLTTAPWHINLFVPMFTSWSEASGLIFVYEPNDDGAPTATTANQGIINIRGDMRISGHALDGGGASVLACNYFPTNGDMIIDTSDDYYANNPMVGTTNVLTHEIGHGLGLFHVCPVNLSKLMEPTVTTAFFGPQEDDILAINRHYGDPEGVNDSSATASFLGNIANPISYSKLQRSIDDNADVDYFSFTVNEATVLTATLTPTGTTYLDGAQNANGSCSAGVPFDALTISDIMVEVLGTDGASIIATANANGPGLAENLVGVGLPLAGTYFVRVRQQGVSVDNVQMYDLNVSLEAGTVLANDVAITAIIEPAAVEIGLTNEEQLLITLSNVGSIAQSNIPYEVSIDGAVVASETYSPILNGGASVNITIPTFVDLSELREYNICVKTLLIGDENTVNDESCKIVEHTICIPATTTGCTQDGIKQFVLGGINVDDGAAGCNTDPGAPTGYADRTALVTDLDRSAGNNVYTLQASTRWNNERIKVWIDLNENNDFTDPGEEVLNQVFTITNGTLENFSVTIPTGTTLGNKRLRARAFDALENVPSTGPCEDIVYGETQDYTVNIIDSSTSCPGVTKTWDGNSWSPAGSPSSIDTAIINGSFTSGVTEDGNVDACTLTVTSSGSLVVPANSFVRTIGNITVDAGGNIEVQHQGSVVQVDATASVINNGTIEVQLTTAMLAPRDFMLIGNPMTLDPRADLAGFRLLVHDTAAFDMFNEQSLLDATNFVDSDNNDWSAHTGVLTPGEGYMYWAAPNLQTGGTFDVEFNDGTLNTGDIVYDITFGDDKNDSPNILANPYASAIDTDMLIANNTAINEVYFWEHNTEPSNAFPGANSANFNMADISIRNAGAGVQATTGGAAPGRYMSTGQGFGIKAAVDTDVIFTNAMRVTGNNNTLRSPETVDRLWLQIKNDTYSDTSTMALAFTDAATAGYDANYDSSRLATTISLYSQIETAPHGYIIQSREAFDNQISIQAGFSSLIDMSSTYTISLSQREGELIENASVYLIDNVTNTVTELTSNSYTFESMGGNFPGRFTIQFVDESILGTPANTDLKIALYPNPTDGVVNVQSPNANISSVSLMDLQGRVIKNHTNLNTNVFTLNMNSLSVAVYFVKIETDSGSMTQRVIKR